MILNLQPANLSQICLEIRNKMWFSKIIFPDLIQNVGIEETLTNKLHAVMHICMTWILIFESNNILWSVLYKKMDVWVTIDLFLSITMPQSTLLKTDFV